MLGHYFLWHLKIRLGKKAPAITPAQLRLLLKTVLPLRIFDAEMSIELIEWIQLRNHRSYLSHRKKQLAKASVYPYLAL
jgi:ABC-type cobalamin transport system ATPase subunit